MLKPIRDVGIVGYGAYVPRYRLPAAEVRRVWKDSSGGLPIKEKAVAGLDEDTITMSIEASRNALARAGIDPQELPRECGWAASRIRTRSSRHRPSSVRRSARRHTSRPPIWNLRARPAAKPWSWAWAWSAQAWGATCWRSAWTPPRGGPAMRWNTPRLPAARRSSSARAEESVAVYEATLSHVTDTPDFWRRAYAHYPSHGHRFTGEPASSSTSPAPGAR